MKMTGGKNLVQMPSDAKVIPRDHVERVARIIGDSSAAADALRRADEHAGPVRFWYSSSQAMLSVELLKPETLH
jgi:hypothetical protein